ncbi:hypothetical protein EBR04_07830 [bacterium]|nr:hypothetical protein [bacterium]
MNRTDQPTRFSPRPTGLAARPDFQQNPAPRRPRCPPLRLHAMGRETKILLGLLGLLAGVFVGVLSMKLFVPRPPDGAGPDQRRGCV